jgi:hypothetical protein
MGMPIKETEEFIISSSGHQHSVGAIFDHAPGKEMIITKVETLLKYTVRHATIDELRDSPGFVEIEGQELINISGDPQSRGTRRAIRTHRLIKQAKEKGTLR